MTSASGSTAKTLAAIDSLLSGSRRPADIRAVLLVVILALAVRFVHVWSTSDVPTIRHLIGDAHGYVEWSQRIAAGNWVGDRGFYQAPLYPYTLAVWRLFGINSVAGIRVLQAMCGAAACVLMYFAVAQMLHARAGLVAGVMLALFGPAIYFDGIIQKASLDGLLVCTMLLGIAMIASRPGMLRCAALGAVVSLLCLTRENAIAWHFVFPVWIAWTALSSVEAKAIVTSGSMPQDPGPPIRPQRVAARLAAYLLGAGMVLAPVGWRNYVVQGEFALTTFQAGPNFYIGNNRNADGRYQPLIRGHETPAFEQRDATELAQKEAGRELTPREVSQYWMRRAWNDIRENPLRWTRLLGYKLLLTWNRYEIADAESIAVYRRYSPVLDALCRVWHFGMLAPLAIFGALTMRGRSRFGVLHALLTVMTLAVCAFYVLGRYRFPLVPLMIPFAAAGWVHIWERIRPSASDASMPAGGSNVPSRVAIVAALATAALVNWPIQDEKRLDAMAEMNAGVALAQAGQIAEAGEFFARTVALHPTSAEANYNLALTLSIQGKYVDAIPRFEQALRSEPQLIGAHFNLAVALERAGRAEEAAAHYRLALQNDPSDREAQEALRRIESRESEGK